MRERRLRRVVEHPVMVALNDARFAAPGLRQLRRCLTEPSRCWSRCAGWERRRSSREAVAARRRSRHQGRSPRTPAAAAPGRAARRRGAGSPAPPHDLHVVFVARSKAYGLDVHRPRSDPAPGGSPERRAGSRSPSPARRSSRGTSGRCCPAHPGRGASRCRRATPAGRKRGRSGSHRTAVGRDAVEARVLEQRGAERGRRALERVPHLPR